MENKPTPEQEVINVKVKELCNLLTENGYKFMLAAFSTQEEHPHNIGAINAKTGELAELIGSLLENINSDTIPLVPFVAAVQLAKDKNPELLDGFKKFLDKDASFMERLKNLFS